MNRSKIEEYIPKNQVSADIFKKYSSLWLSKDDVLKQVKASDELFDLLWIKVLDLVWKWIINHSMTATHTLEIWKAYKKLQELEKNTVEDILSLINQKHINKYTWQEYKKDLLTILQERYPYQYPPFYNIQ